MKTEKGAARIFRVFGIDVFVHSTWLLFAAYELSTRANAYSSQFWNVAEYLSVFVIVLLHEFGHALACRSVGGRAERIMLWPLGGIAYVAPPPRPGAHLWSIAAGPLVNVALLPITMLSAIYVETLFPHASRDFYHFVDMVTFVNWVLLIFNMLPIYPLDGGQVLRSLLWYVVGPVRSLMAAAFIGLIGAGAGMMWALSRQDVWLVIMAFLAASQSWNGFRVARAQQAVKRLPRHADATCPHCREAPPRGEYWGCPCGTRFDAFARQAVCPGCGRTHDPTMCPFCRRSGPLAAWYPALPPEFISGGLPTEPPLA